MSLQRSLSQDLYKKRKKVSTPHFSWICDPSALIRIIPQNKEFQWVTREKWWVNSTFKLSVRYIPLHHIPEHQNKIMALTPERIYRNVVESISRAPIHLFLQQMVTEQLLQARYCSRHRRRSSKQKNRKQTNPASGSLHWGERKQTNK